MNPQPVEAAPPLQPESPISPVGNKKKLFFIGGLLLLFVIGLLATVVLFSRGGNKATNATPSVTPPVTNGSKAPPFPQVSVKEWEVDATTSAQFPKSANVYALRKISTQAEATDLSRHFFESEPPTKTATSISFVSKPSGNDLLYVQTTTGSILMKSLNGLPLVASTSGGFAVSDLVNEFVQKVSGSDPTLAVAATYEKKDTPGVVYYEVHRDWDLVGAPILNLLGVFNLKDKVALSSYTLASKPDGILQDDANILGTSDGRDGKARLRDFNTMTIGVKGSRIVSVTSNLRFLSQTASPTDANLIPYADAVTKLKTGGYSQIYTSPIGSGIVSPDKLYPENKAKLTKVTVTDVAVAYLEELPQQEQLKLIPHYIFRGQGSLESGYEVDFLAAVPAIGNAQTLGTSTHLLAQATGGASAASQKQGTLPTATPTPTPTPTPTNSPTRVPTIAFPTNPPPPVINACTPSIEQLSNVHTTSGGLIYGQYGASDSSRGSQYWYVAAPSGTSLDINQLEEQVTELINSVLNNLDVRQPGESGYKTTKNGVDCYLWPTTGESGEDIMSCISWAGYLYYALDSAQLAAQSNFIGCPVILSSMSPSVFIYSTTPRTFNVKVAARIKYSNASTNDSSWSVAVDNGRLQINGEKREYLYYEYEPKVYNEPEDGWTVQRSQLSKWIAIRASELQLTSAETVRLAFEVSNAASQVVGDTLFIGLIPQSEVGQKLPLSLSQRADVTRLHFYVSATNRSNISPATLKPVVRSDFMLLELGAVSQ